MINRKYSREVVVMLRKIMLFAVLLVVMSCSFVSAQMGMMHGEGMGMMHGEGMGMMQGEGMMMGRLIKDASDDKYSLSLCISRAEEIGLSDEQLAKIKSLHYGQIKSLISLEADKDIKQLEINELLDKASLDLPKIEEKVRDLYEKKLEIKMERLKTRQEVRSLLSEEQQNKLKSLIKERRESFRERWEDSKKKRRRNKRDMGDDYDWRRKKRYRDDDDN